MHPPGVRERVLELSASGVGDGEIARAVGLARPTVRDMVRGRYRRSALTEHCWRCWRRSRPTRLTAGSYAELLGFYLGDGHVLRMARTEKLRVSLDTRHPRVVAHVRALVAQTLPATSVGLALEDGGATSVVWAHSNHWSCLLPQHGPGKKHERRIVLEEWQQRCVDDAPFAFLRGLLWSDGCFFINRTGRYRYLSVSFSNHSSDVRDLFMAACDRAEIRYRPTGREVRVYRRESVTLLSAFVGSKR
jgi:hypothetical protein